MMRQMRGLAVLIFSGFIIGCGTGDVNWSGTVVQEGKDTEANQLRLRTAHPLPKLDRSLELTNLIKRLERINKNNRVAYVYVMSSDGHVVASWVINGKMSSLNSLLTTPEQFAGIRTGEGYHVERMPSPDYDGSYGKNPEGSFWFDVKDQMSEILLGGGMVICTETPMKINTPITLTTIHDPEERKTFEKSARERGPDGASKEQDKGIPKVK
jgi:hypothetical protein